MAYPSERMATWWMHWPDLNWPNADNKERIKRRAEGFAKANVSAAMFFGAHFRWDFLPYFTQLHDYIAAVAEELHQYNVKLFDHHSVNLIHRYDTTEQMRRVMLDSGPHLPFCPSREAAKTWQYQGQLLNNWRMIDVKDGNPLYLPQYTAEGFCPRNPEFRQAYQSYARDLIRTTGIDGLSADDAMYYLHYNACGCDHCREAFRARTGMELPGTEDRSFWGNWDNPAWLEWIDMRHDSAGLFYEELRKTLPENFMLTGCGASSASAVAVMSASDARTFLRGWNYVNMEMSGNTPPYKHDPLTTNVTIPTRLTNASHHQAAAREHGVRAFCTGFAHSTEAANHVWATSKLLGADAWIGTLKMRLGLPGKILDTLPSEQDIVGTAFGFEAQHPELFSGESVGQLGVYFSYETRNHTYYGSIAKGAYRDYSEALRLLFREGLCPHTLFAFPTDASQYPVILLSGIARMVPAELEAMQTYLAAGGKVIVLGPTPIPGCKHSWQLPNQAPAEDTLFTTVPDGVHVQVPAWVKTAQIPDSGDPDCWSQPQAGLHYHPHRLGDTNREQVLALVRQFIKPLPVQLSYSQGYLCATACQGDAITLQLLAEDYDVDINHELDAIRTHRSRVNLLTTIEPIGVDRTLRLQTTRPVQVYTPFHTTAATVQQENDQCIITLPEKCAYAILHFPGTNKEA